MRGRPRAATCRVSCYPARAGWGCSSSASAPTTSASTESSTSAGSTARCTNAAPANSPTASAVEPALSAAPLAGVHVDPAAAADDVPNAPACPMRRRGFQQLPRLLHRDLTASRVALDLRGGHKGPVLQSVQHARDRWRAELHVAREVGDRERHARVKQQPRATRLPRMANGLRPRTASLEGSRPFVWHRGSARPSRSPSSPPRTTATASSPTRPPLPGGRALLPPTRAGRSPARQDSGRDDRRRTSELPAVALELYRPALRAPWWHGTPEEAIVGHSANTGTPIHRANSVILTHLAQVVDLRAPY